MLFGARLLLEKILVHLEAATMENGEWLEAVVHSFIHSFMALIYRLVAAGRYNFRLIESYDKQASKKVNEGKQLGTHSHLALGKPSSLFPTELWFDKCQSN